MLKPQYPKDISTQWKKNQGYLVLVSLTLLCTLPLRAEIDSKKVKSTDQETVSLQQSSTLLAQNRGKKKKARATESQSPDAERSESRKSIRGMDLQPGLGFWMGTSSDSMPFCLIGDIGYHEKDLLYLGGISYASTSKKESGDGLSAVSTVSWMMIDGGAGYKISMGAKSWLEVGGRAGFGIVSWSVKFDVPAQFQQAAAAQGMTDQSGSETYFMATPYAGFNMLLTSAFGIGAELRKPIVLNEKEDAKAEGFILTAKIHYLLR